MRVLKTITEPQTIVICDLYRDNEIPQSAMITDDESSFKIRAKGGKTHRVDSLGFVHILTKEEFLNYDLNSDYEEDDDFYMYIVLNDFVGDICVTGIDGTRETDDFELDDYLEHQLDDYDLLIEVPSGYDVTPRVFSEAMAMVKSGESTKEKVMYLVKETTYFVDSKGEWDGGNFELSIQNDKPEYNSGKTYVYGDEISDEKADNLSGEDGYNVEVKIYDIKELPYDDGLKALKVLNEYDKLKSSL